MTASIGAAHWPVDGRSQEALVEAADAELYRTKRERPEAVVAEAPADPDKSVAPSSASWADAARDLIKADSTESAAAAMVCAVIAICDGSDAFVALADDLGAATEPALAVMGGGSGTGSVLADGNSGMVQVAASGAFLGRSRSIRRGGGLWGRVWQGAKLASEDDGNAVRIGAPLVVSGEVVGILGVVEPSRAKRLNHAREIALIADLGSAALQRLVETKV